MPRRDSQLDEEKRSYGAMWLVCSLLLLVGALWALADDNIFRRPWKKYQAEFNRLEINRLKDAIVAEQARLDADPAYQQAVANVEKARAAVDSREQKQKIADLERQLVRARQEDQSKDLNLRFVKSTLEELRYHFDDALHHEKPTDDIARRIAEGEALKAEREKIYAESQQHIEDLEKQLKTIRQEVKDAEDEVAKLATAREDLKEKLANVSIGYLPGPKSSFPFLGMDWQPKIPKIQQVVLPQFDRNNFDQPVDRVERCTSCHAGINKPGFEDQPNPWKTHPKRELYLTKHPTDKFGCTPCHNGDGTAVNSDQKAHASFID